MAEAIHLEVGVMFFKDGIQSFMEKQGIDVLFADNEDSSLVGFTVGDKDWVAIPADASSPVVTLTPKPK